jgi:signal peptidase I
LKLKALWRANRGFVAFVVLMFMFRSTFADWSDVPSGSMRPTIIEGDRIFVNKMAYDVRLPFTHVSLLRVADPQRGDIALFDSAAADKRLIKRVIGVPGDVVQMRRNRLIINGVLVAYSKDQGRQVEHLPEIGHTVDTTERQRGFGDFGPVQVPPDQYLMLGDSRSNSADSRVIGYVPRSEFVGRSSRVVLSLDYDRYLLPRADRFFKQLI